MSQQSISLTGMADILMPMMQAQDSSHWTYWLAVFTILFSLLVFWRFQSPPLKHIQRQLKRGRISPRDAAHQLAQQKITDAALIQKLDQQRFARQEPQKAAVLALIKEVAHER